MVRKQNGKWVVLDHTGQKVLGSHPDQASAEAQLRAIEAHKHDHFKEMKKKVRG